MSVGPEARNLEGSQRGILPSNLSRLDVFTAGVDCWVSEELLDSPEQIESG
jgi:hypothetical protein